MNLTNLKQMVFDEDAISPVIGVVLMLAIVLILAASVAAFVFGLGNGLEGSSAPQAQFAYEPTGANSYDVVMEGGDDISLNGPSLEIKYSNTSGASQTYDFATDGGYSTVSAGDVASLSDVGSGEIRVVWTNAEGTDSSVISQHTVQ